MSDADRHLMTVFSSALDREAGPARDAYLDEACAGDPELRARVEALLRSHEQAGRFLEPTVVRGHPPEGPDGTGAWEGARAEAGSVVAGRYKLLEEIGEGGMGAVWMAEQTEPVQRRVALKLIKPGMDSRAVVARFEAERQALALMDHPNIAKVLDGGAADDGRPFFVMELVKGTPVTKYCDEKKLPVRERLALFADVCRAVQHAHQKGIIHRDIKPSNVLVAPYDGRSVVKVIDFGIAKATGQKLTEATLFTGFGAVVGTPEYMSPEQAQVNNQDIDTRSDVYSLGVLLYELLTGTTPLTRQRVKEAALLEVLRLVREEEPPRPSTRLSTTDELPNIAAVRGIEPARLSRLLRGELDWIVMKSLEKDRSRRYETANGFAADVDRYLADEPVQACPPSASYRLKKFARRNLAVLATAAAIALVLVAGIAVSAWQAVRATRAEQAESARADAEKKARQEAVDAAEAEKKAKQAALDAAEAEKKAKQEAVEAAVAEKKARDQAQKRLAQIEKGNEILASIFDDVNIEEVRAGAELLEAVLAKRLVKAAEQLEDDAVGDPLVVANLQNRLGRSLIALGYAEAAIPLLTKAHATSAAKQGVDHLHTLAVRNNLASAYLSAEKHDRAASLYEEGLKLSKARFGADHISTLKSMSGLGLAYLGTGRQFDAVPLLEEALNLMKSKPGADHRDTFATMDNLAAAYDMTGRVDKAIALREEALKLMEPKIGADHPGTLATMTNLAMAYQSSGRPDRAIPLLEKAVKLSKPKFGADHPNTLRIMHNLAQAYGFARRFDQAIPLFKAVLKLQRSRLGPGHPDTLTTLHNLAFFYRNAGEFDKVVPIREEQLKLAEAASGADHPDTLWYRHNLARAYQEAWQLDRALEQFERTARSVEKGQFRHRDAGEIIQNTANAYEQAGQPDKADAWRRKWPAALKQISQADPQRYAREVASLRRFDQAILMLEDLLKLQEKEAGREHLHTLIAVANLGVTYKDAGRLKEAIPLLEEVYRASKKHPALREFRSRLQEAYLKAGEKAKVVEMVQDQVAEARKTLPEGSPQLAGVLAVVSLDLLACGEHTVAELLLRECLPIREKTQPDNWTTFNTQSMLGGALLGQKKYADAEPLLLKGYAGMKEREKTIMWQGRDRIPEALDRLIELYTATDKPEEVRKWRAERVKYPPEVAPPPREK